MPVITCTQWDCPGADRDSSGVSHDYDCKFCENRKKAFLSKQKKTFPEGDRS